MSGLYVTTSNRLEILADRLADLLRTPTAVALQPETVVVQSRGMERWISMRLAERNGISANVVFPFPNAFMEHLSRQWIQSDFSDSPFAPEALTYRIMHIVSRSVEREQYSPLKRYLQTGGLSLKLFQLAARIADTFDQYLVFRPDMIFEWEQGRHDLPAEQRWQVELWKTLTADTPRRHRAELQRRLIESIRQSPAVPESLPQRIALFGISYLPPVHLHTLAAVSHRIPVHLFLLNPCREYWADILSETEQRKQIRENVSEKVSAYDLHLDRGNPLLGSLGRLGRDFFSVIHGLEAAVNEQFEDPAGTSRLSRIQSDILNLREGPPRLESGQAASATGDAAPGIDSDATVQIHSCHSPQREIEVLQDQLLAMFDAHPDLQPQDIVVMTPDIEHYAPYIHAVFDTQFDERLRIPYSVADRSPKNDSRLIETFLALLELKESRFTAGRILSLLDSAGIRERFDISDRDLEKIEHWVGELNIRWGRDENQRRRLGLPDYRENTWRSGIERMLLGIALADPEPRMFSDILPYSRIEGGDLETLGRFLEFLDRVFHWGVRLEQTHTLTRWQAELTALLQAFFNVDAGFGSDLALLEATLDSLAQIEATADFHLPVGLDIVRAQLEKRLNHPRYGAGFMTGGVTFCAMLPMRSIPFEVICMVGMNNDVFPRDPAGLGFDLIRSRPRPGDRSQRNDDRYLFLEALVSARRILYISYVGQNIQDNSPVPPSVLVSELIDTLQQRFGLSPETAVTQHPLQGFSRRYFSGEDPRLFSYAAENYTAVREATAGSAPAFFDQSIPGDGTGEIAVDLEALCGFFRHPTRYLLRQRLGLHIEEAHPAVSGDTEDFSLGGLSRYRIGQTLIERRLSGKRVVDTDFLAVFKSMGVLPPGRVGKIQYRDLEGRTEELIRTVQPLVSEGLAGRREVALELDRFRISGSLNGLYDRGRLQAGFSVEHARDLLTAWIKHLVLCVTAIEDSAEVPPVTVLAHLNSIRRFEPVPEPREHLRVLLAAYREGQTRPLHFFPQTSLVFFRCLQAGKKTAADCVDAARREWDGGDFKRGESDDPYHRLVFGREDPLDERFTELARSIYAPLLTHTGQIDAID
jgi:exodeoxyribonuclease V gamma subunit